VSSLLFFGHALLFPNGIEPAKFVVALVEFPQYEVLILPGLLGASLFKGVPNTPVLAL